LLILCLRNSPYRKKILNLINGSHGRSPRSKPGIDRVFLCLFTFYRLVSPLFLTGLNAPQSPRIAPSPTTMRGSAGEKKPVHFKANSREISPPVQPAQRRSVNFLAHLS
jgi:hypothetical protein